ncbi:hypothetical protein [Citrobacter sp. wls619]|uniref:hypothetical protein n=1 Tax=Citrobacter TaxID=544 RepID=UPI0010C9F392|nr:hypothetical protein [Citrobacter sp. wls619]TKV10122.1 hypothetical protein FDX19_10570 [Citrobacter sp. wls619]
MTHDPFAQVRQAHRICGAYYQQILPMINEVAQKIETSFLLWDTWSFNKPPRRGMNPLESWKWDYLPMMDVSFVFGKQKQPSLPMLMTDYVIDFKLVTDSELEYHRRTSQYPKDEEPLATRLKTPVDKSQSYLNIYLFSAANNDTPYSSPEEMWDSYEGYPDTHSKVQFSDNNQIRGIGFSVPLIDIANDNGVNLLVEKILEHREYLMQG